MYFKCKIPSYNKPPPTYLLTQERFFSFLKKRRYNPTGSVTELYQFHLFPTRAGINVPRRRFLPVKTCSDLLLVMSNLYDMKHGRLEMSPLRQFPAVPIVQLSGGYFKKVREHR